MTNRILESMGRKDLPVRILNEAKGEIKEQYLSVEKAKGVLGWEPQYRLENALRETIDWYRSFYGS